jgi:hypothetical protein
VPANSPIQCLRDLGVLLICAYSSSALVLNSKINQVAPEPATGLEVLDYMDEGWRLLRAERVPRPVRGLFLAAGAS